MWGLNPERLWPHGRRTFVVEEKSLFEDMHGFANRLSPFLTVPWYLPYNSGKSHETCQSSQISLDNLLCLFRGLLIFDCLWFRLQVTWPLTNKTTFHFTALKRGSQYQLIFFEFKLSISAMWGGGKGLNKSSWIVNHIGSKWLIRRLLNRSASENMRV
jgi:hypothetical protein